MKILPEEVAKALLQKRQILLIGKVDVEAQEIISGSVIYLNSLSDEPVTLFIDSTGGSVNAEMQLADAIGVSRAPVHGVVTGVAFSAAFCLLQACRLRKAYPNSDLMFHGPALGEIPIDSEKFEGELAKFRKLHQEQLEVYSKRSGQPMEKWAEWSRKEKKFKAREALGLGMIDEIIQPVPLPVFEK